MKKFKPMPKFKNEDQERDFWATHSSLDYLDWSKAKAISFPNLKPSTTTISLRLPVGLLNRIKISAHRSDVPYQSLIKVILDQSFKKDLIIANQKV